MHLDSDSILEMLAPATKIEVAGAFLAWQKTIKVPVSNFNLLEWQEIA